MTTVAPTTEPRWGLGEVGIGLAASFVLSTIVGGIILAIAGWTEPEQIPMWGLALMQIPLWAGYLGAVLYAGSKGDGAVRDFGVSVRPLDVPIGLALGVALQTVALSALYWPIFWLTGTDSGELSRPAEELAERAGGPVSWLLFAVLVGIIAPVVEEIFYRGLFINALRKRGATVAVAIAVSSVVFAAMHLQVLQFPGLLLFGLVSAFLATRTGRLGPSIFTHIGFNMTTVVVLYLNSIDVLG
jgi:uncharacterized protein